MEKWSSRLWSAFRGPVVLTSWNGVSPRSLLSSCLLTIPLAELLFQLLCRPELAETQLQDQTHSKSKAICSSVSSCWPLHLQLAGKLWRGLVLGTHLQSLNGVVTGVLLRKERPSPLNKLAEQYLPKGLESEKQEAALPSRANS